MPLHWPSKDPNEDADYDIDWSSRLAAGDQITNSVWSVVGAPSSLLTSNPLKTATATKITLQGGTLNATYTLINTVTTLFVPSLVESATVTIKSK